MIYQDALQFRGRRIVGHYAFGGRAGDNGVSNQRYLSLRNPLASGRRMHVVRLAHTLDIIVPGVAITYMSVGFRVAPAYTVTDTTGGSALADASYIRMSGSAASVVEGRHGAALTGGTVGTLRNALALTSAAQPGAGTLAPGQPQHHGRGSWSAAESGEPIDLGEDQGVVYGAFDGSGAGTTNLVYEIEWYESEPIVIPGFAG